MLQESEEQDSEEANVDGNITAEANKKSMKTITTRLFQWKKNRRLWNIKKQWKEMSKISPDHGTKTYPLFVVPIGNKKVT